MLPSASDKAKLFAKDFSKSTSLKDSGLSLLVFHSTPNLKLHYISVTLKMVEKVITNLASSNASGHDFIPVVIVKNCDKEFSYILAELFKICLKESYLPGC